MTRRRLVSTTERISFAPHSVRNPLVILQNTAQGALGAVVGRRQIAVGHEDEEISPVLLIMRCSLTPASCVRWRAMSSSRHASSRAA
jgi:hypothetical protein